MQREVHCHHESRVLVPIIAEWLSSNTAAAFIDVVQRGIVILKLIKSCITISVLIVIKVLGSNLYGLLDIIKRRRAALGGFRAGIFIAEETVVENGNVKESGKEERESDNECEKGAKRVF